MSRKTHWLCRNTGDEFLDLFSGNRPRQIEGYWTGEEIPGCTWMSRVAPGSINIKVNEGECVYVELVRIPDPLDALDLDMKADPEGASTIVSSERLAELTSLGTP